MNSVEVLRRALQTSYEWIGSLAEDLGDSPMTPPTSRGGNHALWVLGHLAFSRRGLHSFITGQPNPLAAWEPLFSGGTEPSQDPAAYPSFKVIREQYRDAHAETLALLENVGENRLDEAPRHLPTPFKDFPDFASIGRIFLFIAMHDMSHRGQLADIRRALGRKPLM